MSKKESKPVIGLTGGICSGKSTVAREFEKLGCGVIDADKLAHEVLLRGDIQRSIVEIFGEQAVAPDGTVERCKLARIVFEDKQKLEKLNSLIHPVVLAKSKELIEQYRSHDDIKCIVLDIPLLIETGWEKYCDYVVFVESDFSKRLERAKKRGISDENQFKKRENFQISLDIKKNISDNTIINNFSLAELSEQVVKIFSYVVNNG